MQLFRTNISLSCPSSCALGAQVGFCVFWPLQLLGWRRWLHLQLCKIKSCLAHLLLSLRVELRARRKVDVAERRRRRRRRHLLDEVKPINRLPLVRSSALNCSAQENWRRLAVVFGKLSLACCYCAVALVHSVGCSLGNIVRWAAPARHLLPSAHTRRRHMRTASRRRRRRRRR